MPRSPITAVATIRAKAGAYTITLTDDAADILGFDRIVGVGGPITAHRAAREVQEELDASFADAQ